MADLPQPLRLVRLGWLMIIAAQATSQPLPSITPLSPDTWPSSLDMSITSSQSFNMLGPYAARLAMGTTTSSSPNGGFRPPHLMSMVVTGLGGPRARVAVRLTPSRYLAGANLKRDVWTETS